MNRRARLLSVAGIVLCGAVGVLASTQTWFTVTLEGPTEHVLTVPGSTALAVLTPLSLAVMALGAALSIVGLILRYVFGVLTVAIASVLAVLTARLAITHPASAVARVVTDATGITGDAPVAHLIARIDTSGWAFVALAAWVVLLAAGVFVLVTARRWGAGGRRYRTDVAGGAHQSGPLDAVDSWDDLSRGEDPTSDSAPR